MFFQFVFDSLLILALELMTKRNIKSNQGVVILYQLNYDNL